MGRQYPISPTMEQAHPIVDVVRRTSVQQWQSSLDKSSLIQSFRLENFQVRTASWMINTHPWTLQVLETRLSCNWTLWACFGLDISWVHWPLVLKQNNYRTPRNIKCSVRVLWPCVPIRPCLEVSIGLFIKLLACTCSVRNTLTSSDDLVKYFEENFISHKIGPGIKWYKRSASSGFDTLNYKTIWFYLSKIQRFQ